MLVGNSSGDGCVGNSLGMESRSQAEHEDGQGENGVGGSLVSLCGHKGFFVAAILSCGEGEEFLYRWKPGDRTSSGPTSETVPSSATDTTKDRMIEA